MTTTTMTMTAAAWLALVLGAAAAHADPCDRDRMPPPSPVTLSLGPADFASTPAVCGRNAGRLEGRAGLLIDRPDFYGAIDLGLVAAASVAYGRNLWFDATIGFVQYQQAINATIVADQVDLGPATIGVHRTTFRRERWVETPFVRLLLPTDTAYRYAARTGIEVGTADLFAIVPQLTAAVGLSLPLSVTVLGARASWLFTPRLSVDVAYAPAHWVEVAAGIEARLGTDAAGLLEFLAPKIAWRFYPYRGLAAQFTLMLPMAGLERTDYRIALSLGWVQERRTDPRPPGRAPPPAAAVQ